MSELLNSGKFDFGQDKESIIKNWDNSGLLYGLDAAMTEKTAMTLEAVAQKLLADREWSLELMLPDYEVIIFPIVRRVISELFDGKHNLKGGMDGVAMAELIDSDFIFNEIHRISSSVINMFELIYKDCSNKSIDLEAEACAFIATKTAHLFAISLKYKKGE